MATMSTFIINCTTKHQHKVEEVAPEESSIYWWKTSEISHFTFLCLNHRSFIRIFSNCRFLDQTWPCFNLHVTDPLRTVTEMSEALAEPCPVTESWWKCDDMKLMPMSQLSAMSIYFEICCCDQITPTRTVSMCSLKHIIINAFKSNHYKNYENKSLYLNMHPFFSFSSTSTLHSTV